jgi:hypothetical protein
LCNECMGMELCCVGGGWPEWCSVCSDCRVQCAFRETTSCPGQMWPCTSCDQPTCFDCNHANHYNLTDCGYAVLCHTCFNEFWEDAGRPTRKCKKNCNESEVEDDDEDDDEEDEDTPCSDEEKMND